VGAALVTPLVYEENFLVGNRAGLDVQVADSFVFRLRRVPSTATIRCSGGAGVCWSTIQEDELTLLEVAGALAELGIGCGDRVRVAVEGEGDAPRVVVDEIKRALDDFPPSQTEMLVSVALGEATFLRFMPPALNGRSMDRRTGEVHAGVSAFSGRLVNETIYEIDITQVDRNTVEILEIALRCAAPAFFLLGPVVGLGPGNEPLVAVERFWPVPRSVDLTVASVSNSPTDRRIAKEAEHWNRSPYVGKLVAAAKRRRQAPAASLAMPSLASCAVKPFCFYPPDIEKKLREWGYL